MRRFALIAALLALALPGLAKEPAPAVSPQPASAPAPIPLPALVFEAESAERFARSVQEQAEPSAELARIEGVLAKLTRELEQRSAQIEKLTGEIAPIVALDSELRAFELASERLERWQRVPTKQLVVLGKSLDEIGERLEVWELTRQSAATSHAPPEAHARIQAVRSALRSAQRHAIAAQRGLVDLQARISRQEANAREALDALRKARLEVRSALLTRDSPALWNAFSAAAGPSPMVRLVADARAAREYVETSWPRIAAQLALFVLIAGFALSLRGRAGHLHEDPRLVASAVIFDRPFSSAALLVIALNSAFHPNAPAAALLTLWLVAILAVLRVLPGPVDAALKPVIWAVAALAVLDAVGVALASITPVERALFSLKLAVATVALFWVMRPVRLAFVPDPAQVPRFLHPLLQLARGAFAAAFVASLLGWSNLAHLIGDGTLRSAYAALTIYPAARVLRAGLRATARSAAFSRARLFRDHAESVIATGARVVNAAGLALWAVRTLDGFGLWHGVLALGGAIWTQQIGFGSLSLTLGDVLTFGLTIWASLLLARFARFVLEGDVVARFDPRRGVAHAVGATAQYLLLLVGFFVAATASGIDGTLRRAGGRLRRRHRLRAAERHQQLRVRADPALRAADPGRRHHRGGHRSDRRGAAHRRALEHRAHAGGRARDRAEREPDLRAGHELDARGAWTCASAWPTEATRGA
jgi:hypothetical protein